jgi:hypothetical protein
MRVKIYIVKIINKFTLKQLPLIYKLVAMNFTFKIPFHIAELTVRFH